MLDVRQSGMKQDSLSQNFQGRTHPRPVLGRTILEPCASPGKWCVQEKARADTDPIRLRLSENVPIVQTGDCYGELGWHTRLIACSIMRDLVRPFHDASWLS